MIGSVCGATIEGQQLMGDDKRQPNEKLCRARELRGWSQRYVAEQIGTTEHVVSRWESGQHKPNRYFQTELCKLFGKNAEELGFMPSQEQEEISLQAESIITVKQGDIELNELRRLFLQGIAGFAASPSLIVQPTPEFITRANSTIAYCWKLYFSGLSFLVEPFLLSALPQLTPFVQHSTRYRESFAGIVSQINQILCDHNTDQENYGAALKFGQQALIYSQESGDHNLEVTALIRLANMYFHQKQTLYASRAYKQALPIVDKVSPLLRGRVYVGLAEVLAMCGEKQEALRYMGLAYDSFPEHPEYDPAYYYTHFSRYSLYVFGDGQTRLSLGQAKEAQESFTYAEHNLIGLESEPLSQVDLQYYRTLSSFNLGSLDEGAHHIHAAVTGAKKANSRLYYSKILAVYQQMQQKWKHEPRLHELEEIFQPW